MEKSIDKFFLELFTMDDYDMFCKWWGDSPPKETTLPDMGFNIGNKMIGFLADTDTDFMIMTWWQCNPDNTARESHEALRRYIMICKEAAKMKGKNYVFCYTNKRGMIRLLESHNFNNFDGHFVAELSNE